MPGYTTLDDLVNHQGGVSTLRQLYASGLLELRIVNRFHESKSRVGRRWFADLVDESQEDGRMGFMIRRRDYLYLLDEVIPAPIIGQVAASGPRSRPSALAELLADI